MTYVFECVICGKKFEVSQNMNDAHIACHCGRCARRVWLPFETDKDLMYQFDTTIFGKNPVNIYSRRQYKRLLKENNLADSTPRESLQVKRTSERDHKSRIHKFAKKLTDKIYKKGAMDFVTAPLRGRA